VNLTANHLVLGSKAGWWYSSFFRNKRLVLPVAVPHGKTCSLGMYGIGVKNHTLPTFYHRREAG